MQQESNSSNQKTPTIEELQNAVILLSKQVLILATGLEETKRAMAGLVGYLQAKEQADGQVRQED